MSRIIFSIIKLLADLNGIIHDWYLRHVYLPLLKSGVDVGKINFCLAYADWRETHLILEQMGAQIHRTAYLETRLLIQNA